MFLKLIRKYVEIFVATIIFYSVLNWFFTTKTGVININEKYINFWIPLILGYFFSYFIFRPVLKKVKFKEKAFDFSIWILIPLSIGVSTGNSQKYFKDKSQSVIHVEKPSDILKYPDGKFFKISEFIVLPDKFFVLREHHTSGRTGNILNISNYYITPIIDDTFHSEQLSNIGFGVKFSASTSNALLIKKSSQLSEIKAFNKQSQIDYNNYNFYEVDYFQKQENNDNAEYFEEALKYHPGFDKNKKPVIVTKQNGTITELYRKDLNLLIYSTSFCFGLTIIFFILFYAFKNEPSEF